MTNIFAAYVSPNKYESKHLYHITDTFDHRARGKIDGAYTRHKGQLGISDIGGYSFIPGVNSIDVGISASEFYTNSQRPDVVIQAINYAPPDNRNGTKDNARKDFFGTTFVNSKDVLCGTNNGYEGSYLKRDIDQVFRLVKTNELKSQFRSLEILPAFTLLFSDPQYRERMLKDGIIQQVEDIDAIVPSAPEATHAFEIDNFLNVKFFPSVDDLNLLRQYAEKKEALQFSFGNASIETGAHNLLATAGQYEAVAAPTLFDAGEGKNVVALRSSSKLLEQFGLPGEETCVPIIATIRQRPAETSPNYTPPPIGAVVRLTPKALLKAG